MRILLADDHPLFLEGLKSFLSLHGMEVVGTARNGLEAVEKARALKPEVILMDIIMPYLDGLAATRQVKAELPATKIVMLTISGEDKDLFEAIKSGACGYLLKTEDTERFIELLQGLVRGEAPLSQGLASRVLEEFARINPVGGTFERTVEKDEALTAREVEVLTLVAQGLSYKQVGEKLCLSERTIKYHIGEIIQRLQLENRRQAIEYAKRMNFRMSTRLTETKKA